MPGCCPRGRRPRRAANGRRGPAGRDRRGSTSLPSSGSAGSPTRARLAPRLARNPLCHARRDFRSPVASQVEHDRVTVSPLEHRPPHTGEASATTRPRLAIGAERVGLRFRAVDGSARHQIWTSRKAGLLHRVHRSVGRERRFSPRRPGAQAEAISVLDRRRFTCDERDRVVVVPGAVGRSGIDDGVGAGGLTAQDGVGLGDAGVFGCSAELDLRADATDLTRLPTRISVLGQACMSAQGSDPGRRCRPRRCRRRAPGSPVTTATHGAAAATGRDESVRRGVRLPRSVVESHRTTIASARSARRCAASSPAVIWPKSAS
jgi:hypothetical protein